MVGMDKDVADIIIELYKGECLMSLVLECRDTWSNRTRYEGSRLWEIVPVSQFSESSLLEWSSFAMGPGSSSMIPSIPISPLVWILVELLLASMLL
jgi:hypothetical protein